MYIFNSYLKNPQKPPKFARDTSLGKREFIKVNKHGISVHVVPRKCISMNVNLSPNFGQRGPYFFLYFSCGSLMRFLSVLYPSSWNYPFILFPQTRHQKNLNKQRARLSKTIVKAWFTYDDTRLLFIFVSKAKAASSQDETIFIVRPRCLKTLAPIFDHHNLFQPERMRFQDAIFKPNGGLYS